MRALLPLAALALTVAVALLVPASTLGDEVPVPAAPGAVPAPAPAVPAPAEPAGVAFEPGTPPLADLLAKAKAEGKPVFLDFATEWCGWCVRLEEDTFSRPEVAEVMKDFVNAHVDAEKGEGPDLAKRYGVDGFPTLVIVDPSGDEIDRIVGYLPPAEFTGEIRRILRGEGTLPALRRRFAENPADVDAGILLGGKLVQSRAAEAVDLFRGLLDAVPDRAAQARVRLELAAALVEDGRAAEGLVEAETLVRDFADTPAAGGAADRVGGEFLRQDDEGRALAFLAAARAAAKDPDDRRSVEDLAIAFHKQGISAALGRLGEAAGDDPQALNEVAWACFQEKVCLREAVDWASRAVDLSERDPMILDTLANLLWVVGAREEALKLETEAAGKAAGPLRKVFEATAARWVSEFEAMAAGGAIPAVPLVPAPAK